MDKKQMMNTIDHHKVNINDKFWSPRIEMNRKQTIPHQYEKCKETRRIDGFRLDWKPGMEPKPHIFWVPQVAKWIEAASHSLAHDPDPKLESLLDEVIDLVVSAQQPDGYINIYYTVVEPERRWTDLRDGHEMFVAGHLIESGVAHYQTTGSRKLLDAVCRFADHIDSLFGTEPGKKRGYPGHQELELALVKLYRATGEQKYLKLSQYFIDERGQRPNYFVEEGRLRNTPNFFKRDLTQEAEEEYNQSHLPVREQTKAVGHAVRAMFLYCAMADLAKELGDESLLRACERLWEDVYSKHMFIHGGIGQEKKIEGFSYDYDLPNETTYAETCAGIGMVMWNQRMLLLDCDRKYADVMERALYNGVLSGISLDGKKFFYQNRLASQGNFHRKYWLKVSCCPPNIARLLASLGGYIYTQNEQSVAVHLYIQSSVELQIKDQKVTLSQKSDYPWNGLIQLNLDMEKGEQFAIKLRIPEWCQKAALRVNQEEISVEDHMQKGYLTIERLWGPNDQIQLDLDMPVLRWYSHPETRQNVGSVALQRGPLVYCLEGVDHPGISLQRISLPEDSEITASFDEHLLGGVVALHAQARRTELHEDWKNSLYSIEKPKKFSPIHIQAIPYYAWDHRDPGQMRVWQHY
jgi:DUF1680 family protein